MAGRIGFLNAQNILCIECKREKLPQMGVRTRQGPKRYQFDEIPTNPRVKHALFVKLEPIRP